jgi:hypothetical protein
VHLARKKTNGASAHRLATIVVAVLALLVIVSVLGSIPTFHQALGIGSTDALDEGVLIPKMSTSTSGMTTVFGVLALAFLLAASTSRKPRAVRVIASGAGAPIRPRAAVSVRRRMRRTTPSDDDADHHHTSIVTTPALRSAPDSAQPEGFSVSLFRSALHREEGSSAR